MTGKFCTCKRIGSLWLLGTFEIEIDPECEIHGELFNKESEQTEWKIIAQNENSLFVQSQIAVSVKTIQRAFLMMTNAPII